MYNINLIETSPWLSQAVHVKSKLNSIGKKAELKPNSNEPS